MTPGGNLDPDTASDPNGATMPDASTRPDTATKPDASTRPDTATDPLIPGLLSGDRRSLAQSITLIESTRDDHRSRADAVLTEALSHADTAIRVGISGAPGVGKSTFIEALGIHLVEAGHRVAVLAVDPSSRRSGGSILGDKTRMERLARSPDAFIRPSPAGTTLGGVARRTREAMLLCEAAGFDVVLVETVGVGQSELAVADMVDLFVLLVSPGGGDELQGIKRGIMELADLVVVTKADGDLTAAAHVARADHKRALQLLRRPHLELEPTALEVSSPTGEGIAEVWMRLAADHATLRSSGALDRLRVRQRKAWFWSEVHEQLSARLARDPRVSDEVGRLEAAVQAGEITPSAAASHLLDAAG